MSATLVDETYIDAFDRERRVSPDVRDAVIAAMGPDVPASDGVAVIRRGATLPAAGSAAPRRTTATASDAGSSVPMAAITASRTSGETLRSRSKASV